VTGPVCRAIVTVLSSWWVLGDRQDIQHFEEGMKSFGWLRPRAQVEPRLLGPEGSTNTSQTSK
jgi:hypothetical protein